MTKSANRDGGKGLPHGMCAMTRLVLFKGAFDPWHMPDETDLSKTG